MQVVNGLHRNSVTTPYCSFYPFSFRFIRGIFIRFSHKRIPHAFPFASSKRIHIADHLRTCGSKLSLARYSLFLIHLQIQQLLLKQLRILLSKFSRKQSLSWESMQFRTSRRKSRLIFFSSKPVPQLYDVKESEHFTIITSPMQSDLMRFHSETKVFEYNKRMNAR